MRDEDINYQCWYCHLLYDGPQAGRNPGRQILSAGATPEQDSAHVDDAHPFNVSHGHCGRLHEQRMLEDMHRQVYRERDRRRVQDELDRRKFWRRRPQ